MSSTRRWCLGLTLALLGARGQEVSCPLEVETRVRAEMPEIWTQESQVTRIRFLRAEVFNKVEGKVFLLAPDSETVKAGRLTQKWALGQYRDLPLYLKCVYRGSSFTLTHKLDAPLRECVFEGRLSGGNGRLPEGGRIHCQ